MVQENFKTIENIVSDLIKKMGFEGRVKIEKLPGLFLVQNGQQDQQSSNNAWLIDVQTNDSSNILIGRHGSNLEALQHLVRVIIQHKIPQPNQFVLDINDYKKQRVKFLKELAENMAARVRQTKKAQSLQPMFPYERRIIHLQLSDKEGIATESSGREPGRRVIIKPS